MHNGVPLARVPWATLLSLQGLKGRGSPIILYLSDYPVTVNSNEILAQSVRITNLLRPRKLNAI